MAIWPNESNQPARYEFDSDFVGWLTENYNIANNIECWNDFISDIASHVNYLIKCAYLNQNIQSKWQFIHCFIFEKFHMWLYNHINQK